MDREKRVATTTNAILEAALDYAERGWRVVPLHWNANKGVCSCVKGSKCPTPGKHPYGREWQKAATANVETLERFWDRHPRANVGIQMGEQSGIVDFEADDDEQEKIFLQLFDDEPPVTATFKSSRGKHRLFRWRSDLPGGAIVNIGSLVLRVGNGSLGSMSVFPPSWHPSGIQYQWVLHPDDCDIATIPDSVLAKIWNRDGVEGLIKDVSAKRPQEHWDRILSGVQEGCRDSSMISYIGKLLRTSVDLSDETTVQVIYESVRAINERNKPPLPEEALRKDFLSILKKEQNRRTTEKTGPALRDPPEVQVDGSPDLKGMSLVIVRADPPLYELHARQFSKAERGCLLLTAEQLVSASKIKVEALKQADYPLPKTFQRLWDGTQKEPGLYERLVFHAEEREAPLEQKRHLVVAERLRDRLSKPRILQDGQEPDARGRPCKLQDGSIVFGFTTVWEELSMGPDRITRPEMSKILERIGAVWYQQRKFKRLHPAALAALDQLLTGEGSEPVNQ